MPLKAKDKYGRLTFIDDAISGDMYYCQICNQPMIQRHCTIRIDHFAHYSPHGRPDIVPCSDRWGYDKTDWHMQWQKRFPADNMERVLEYHGEKHIADILLNDIVVEFQHSAISLDEFNERNEFYTKLGYKVIWVFDLTEEIENGRLAENGYEYYYKWAHARKLFREMNFEEIKATVYFQMSNTDEEGVGVIERVKEVHDCGRLIKTDPKCTFSIKEFVDSISSNSKDLFEKPKAPDSIRNCKTIIDLWKSSYSTMIIANNYTSQVFFVFGKDGNIIRDIRTHKIRCKYAFKDSTGYFKSKGDFYSIQDEEKKIWSLIYAYKDNNYEARIAQQRALEEQREEERKARQEERNKLLAAEQDGCKSLIQLVKESEERVFDVKNVMNGKYYFVKTSFSSTGICIYEIDQVTRALLNSDDKSHEMRKYFDYKFWKKV